MISVAEARTRILRDLRAMPSEVVALDRAHGRFLAEDIIARVTQPPFDVSAMDGYAVRAEDVSSVPAVLTVVGESAAGGRHSGTVEPGQAVRIFTGAPVPPGANAIVIQEDTEAGNGKVTVREGVVAGTYIRRAGLDFLAGDVGVAAGCRLTARHVGLAAAMNVPWIAVASRPRIGLIATGDEIVRPGEDIGDSQIVSSNALALSGLIRATGGQPVDLGIARDNEQSLRRLAQGADSVDMVVTLGGASVGEHDLIRDVLGADGLELDFWQIAMRPGKPLMSGRIAGTPMLGMPGNPVSSLVCGLLFLRPAILTMLGASSVDLPEISVRLGRDLKANDRREDYLRCTLDTDAEGNASASRFCAGVRANAGLGFVDFTGELRAVKNDGLCRCAPLLRLLCSSSARSFRLLPPLVSAAGVSANGSCS